MRVLIAGGGTGGHILPALAIAAELKRSYSAEICFVGTRRGLETRLIPQAGYRLELIEVGQLNHVGWTTRLRTLSVLPKAVVDCIRLLDRLHSNIVIGVGGYASGPAMLAAVIRRVPTLAFEPNAIPGMANRLIGRFVSTAAVNFEATARYFRMAEVTGTPVRAEFFSLASKPAGTKPRLLVFGGSQGARVFNRIMPRIVSDLLSAVPGLTVLHQAGGRNCEETQAAYLAGGAPGDRWQVAAYLDDMPRQFEMADLILCRSGAGTVAELAAAGKPSLLVPFPKAADDHQRKNAEVLVTAGAARLLLEKTMSPQRLLEELSGLLQDRERLLEMGSRARGLAHVDAARRIAQMAANCAAP